MDNVNLTPADIQDLADDLVNRGFDRFQEKFSEKGMSFGNISVRDLVAQIALHSAELYQYFNYQGNLDNAFIEKKLTDIFNYIWMAKMNWEE